MIIVSYVYKKPIIIIEHKSEHKFQMCKEDGFTNFKFDYTWQHDSLTKLSFIKSASPKHVIFERSCKLHHISYLAMINYLWLLSIKLFRWSPIVWKSHQYVHDVLNNSLCLWIWVIHVMDQFPKWHLGWIVHKIFCIPIIIPYDICLPTHQICFRPQSCGMLFRHSWKGICSSWLTVNKKTILGHLINILFYFWFALVASCSFTKPYNDGVTSCKHSISPQSHTPMYTNIWFI